MSSEDTAVNLKGTFAVKLRANNGLNRVAAYLNENRMARVPIVGYVEFHKVVETTDGDTMTVDLIAVEPAVAADGTDVKGWGRQTFKTLDEIRMAHGKGRVADTLFVTGAAPEIDGQLAALSRGDAGDEGDDEGPAEKSGEELLAERAEGTPAADLDADEGRAGSPHESSDPEQVAQGDEVGAKRAERTPRGARKRPAAAAADPFKAAPDA